MATKAKRKAKTFFYELGEAVEITVSGETGIVTGRTDNINQDDQFLIHYKANDGRAVSEWYYASQLALTE